MSEDISLTHSRREFKCYSTMEKVIMKIKAKLVNEKANHRTHYNVTNN